MAGGTPKRLRGATAHAVRGFAATVAFRRPSQDSVRADCQWTSRTLRLPGRVFEVGARGTGSWHACEHDERSRRALTCQTQNVAAQATLEAYRSTVLA